MSRTTSHYVLAILLVVSVVNFIDRQILSILLQSIKDEFGVSDTAMGFLTGPAFALFYTCAGIPIARWSDRATRRNIIALGLTAWSVLTACSGLARNFSELALARIGVGVGEATSAPASHSMISDLFPPERRATALAIFATGGYLGTLFGLTLGGWIDQYFGWRMAFFAVGLPGIALAVMVRFSVIEPPRGQSEGLNPDHAQPGTLEVFRYLWRLHSFRHLCAASALFFFAGYGFMGWTPTFLRRVYDLSPAEVGTAVGLVLGLAGGLGTLAGGVLVDRLSPKDARWHTWIGAIGGLTMTPFLALFLFAPNWMVGLALLAPGVLLGQFYIGPTFAVVQGLARLRMRAMASAIMLFVMNLIGLGLGPQAVGILNDLLAPRFGEEAIRYSMLLVALANLWAVGHALWAAHNLRADLQSARDED